MVLTKSISESDLESGTKTIPIDSPTSKNKARPTGWLTDKPQEFSAGLIYCFFSLSMTLVNKLLMSGFDFHAPNTLLLIQFVMTVLLVDISSSIGLVVRDPLEWRIVKIWWPVNVLFVAMVGTGFYALKTLQVPMVTLFKNLTNLVVILGDLFFFDKRYPVGVWASLGLMVLASVVGGFTDLYFDALGYSWMFFNCLTTASYVLYLKHVLTRVEQVTAKSGGFGDISKVYYNHILGIPLLCILIVVVGEHSIIGEQKAIHDPWFIVAVLFSGVAGFAISYSALRFLSVTTSTTFAMVGALNKIPTAVLGWILFRVKTTLLNVLSVLVGLSAAIIFVKAKSSLKK